MEYALQNNKFLDLYIKSKAKLNWELRATYIDGLLHDCSHIEENLIQSQGSGAAHHILYEYKKKTKR